jgi:hypothetical protein
VVPFLLILNYYFVKKKNLRYQKKYNSFKIVYYVIRSKNVLCAEAGSFSLIPFSFSLGLCISTPPSLFLFPLYLSRPPLSSLFFLLSTSLSVSSFRF